jgi:uncharacterized integral membrane protein
VKRVYWIIVLPLALAVAAWAIANRQPVELSFYPLPVVVEFPLYVLILLSVAVGFVIGALGAWWAGRIYRRRSRQVRRQVREMAGQLAEAQSAGARTGRNLPAEIERL